MISRRAFLQHAAAATVTAGALTARRAESAARRPNVVFILADDIGYGDLGCYGAAKVKTPHLDRLAREGRRFTDAHSPAAVCTPTRYGLLTGEYAWRSESGSRILSGVAPLAINPARPTLPSVLRGAGYATGIVGKWHLGLGAEIDPVNYNEDIAPGPPDIGFDYSFIIPATGDRVPCVYVENRRVVGLDPGDPIQVSYGEKVGSDPTGLEHPELLKIKADESHSKTIVNGISRIGYMSGGSAARWIDETMPEVLAGKAAAFIEQHRETPFFLYFAPHDIHEPMIPNERFRGSSGCGWRGDVIQQLDWTVGEVLGALKRHGLAENTLVIFSSDNGGAIKDTYDDGTNALHALQPPNGALRGEKGTLYEGGNRVPLIARWPGHIEPESTCDQVIALVDMLATFAALAETPLPENAGPDSFNLLPLFSEQAAAGRDHLVMQANGPARLAIRKGPWKLLVYPNANIPGHPALELYNLADDLQETTNLAKTHPDKVQELSTLLEQLKTNGRSRPR